MRLSSALHLYRVRLRARLAHESLVLAGIAAGVALLFAAQVAGASLQSSVAQIARGVEGHASLQLRARGPDGVPQSVLAQVRKISGVQAAAPLLESAAQASGPRGSRPVELIGADGSLAKLGGALVAHSSLAPFGGIAAVVLPAPLSRAIGITRFGQEARFDLAGKTAWVPLYQRLGRRQIGSLAESPVAIAPLLAVQEMTGLPGRISRVLVEPQPGQRASVRARLVAMARGRMNLEPAGYDATLFSTASAASNQSTELFAVIGALIGFLFAFNAMLLTVPQRRALAAALRRDGYTSGAVAGVLLIDAAILGVAACACGILLGQELSIHLLGSDSTFLTLAFTIGPQRAVGWQSVSIAVAGGMLAALVGVIGPMWEAILRDPLAMAADRHKQLQRMPADGMLALAGLCCLGVSTVILLAAPQASIPGMVLLLSALLLELPLALSATLGLARRMACTVPGIVTHIATSELRASRHRALAIAATGSIAVFGSVSIEGAHHDLLAGLERVARETNAAAQVWVAPAGSYDVLRTSAFAPAAQPQLEHLPGVRAVGLFRGGLLDYGDRRVLVTAPPADAQPLLATAELLGANARQAIRHVRAGGWLILSQAIAKEHHLVVGERIRLPTPDPRPFRIAALSTNLGWAPGAIVMSASSYAEAWASPAISAYGLSLAPGFPIGRAFAEINRALGGHSGLRPESARQSATQQRALDRQALARLGQIAVLIPIAAVLAMAAAMGAMIWQRRPRLAKLKLDGLARAELWRMILLESSLLLGVSCLIGAAFGLYGQQLADRALAEVVNFPIVYSLTLSAALRSIALVTAAAVAVLVIPGYLAAAVPASLALQD